VDPFSPEADPDRARHATDAPLTTGRRAMTTALVLAPLALAAVPGCARVLPACPTQPGDEARCKHRFCRHYAGG
jgi:hypothetical protein